MLLPLRRNAGRVDAVDAVDLLLECHQRIRHFTSVAVALAGTAGAPAGEIAGAASGVVRYFTEAMPKHAADEDESIAPRLLATELPAPVRAAVMSMTREHEALHEALAELLPRWRAVAADPARLAAQAEALGPLTSRFAALWSAHLAEEESTVFPAIRRALPPDSLAAILHEMRARRQSP